MERYKSILNEIKMSHPLSKQSNKVDLEISKYIKDAKTYKGNSKKLGKIKDSWNNLQNSMIDYESSIIE